MLFENKGKPHYVMKLQRFSSGLMRKQGSRIIPVPIHGRN
jgi:hypothetical protein